MKNFKAGDRVKVIGHHRWMPDRDGIIKQVKKTSGNSLLVRFDQDELGLWHDEDGDPVLFLSAKDLLPAEAQDILAA
jgi:hypothetical protein